MALVRRSEKGVDSRLAEALDQNDDWTGISDPAARRKLQNKLNQRARRRRQAPGKSTPLRSRLADVQRGHQVAAAPSWMQPMGVTRNGKNTPEDSSPLSPKKTVEITVHRRYGADLRFPLSADHLIHLVQLNVYRALLANMLSLGQRHIFACTTDLDECDTRVLSALPLPAEVPPLLSPTVLQQTMLHPPWIDLFPLPALRDSLLRAHEDFDECELYVDVLGFIGNKSWQSDGEPYIRVPRTGDTAGDSAGSATDNDYNTSERTGVVVWGDPWLVESWEVEEGFLRKWGWLLRDGCDGLLRSTDRWRRLRGDEPMDWVGLGLRLKD